MLKLSSRYSNKLFIDYNCVAPFELIFFIFLIVSAHDPLSPKPLYHKELFAGKRADWTGKPVPREIYFTCTPLAENHNHREFGLK